RNWNTIPQGGLGTRIRQSRQRIEYHLKNFFLLNTREKADFLRQKLQDLRSRSEVWRGMFLRRFSRDRENESNVRVLADIWDFNDRASLEYRAKPYDGVVTDFR